MYRCYDIGCDDFDRAEQNRKMIADKENIEAYLKVEEALDRTPLRRPLPSWIPLGEGYSRYMVIGGACFQEEDRASLEEVVDRRGVDKSNPV